MKTHIFPYCECVDMDANARYDLRKRITTDLSNWFCWEDYSPKYTHLIIYAELDGEAYVYKHGWVATEKEFEELVANREGIGYVHAFHRDSCQAFHYHRS